MLFVAEIGMNYEANLDLAYELIRQAKYSGANIAKFQLGWRDEPGDINHLDIQRTKKLREWCDEFDLEFMASIISEEALEIAKEINPRRFKIASRTVIDKPKLCKEILSLKKETFVSLGMWEEAAFPFGDPDNNLKYVYCVSKYPTYRWDLANMPVEFNHNQFVGYSDHSHGLSACLLAISRGAQYIEKHFTLNKTSQSIRDHTLSATPQEFEELTRLGREIYSLIHIQGE